MRSTTGWQADGTTRTLRRAALERRDLRPDDIAVRVDYCGVCHTDLHALDAHGSDANGVLVPGHEFTGVVTEVGGAVADFAPGDPVAVGNIVDSCGKCRMCQAGQENFCREFPTLTYGGADRQDGSTTLGGYAREYVVSHRFAYRLPAGLDAAATAPLLCAGCHRLGTVAGARRGTWKYRRRGRTWRPGTPRGQDGGRARGHDLRHQPDPGQGRRGARAGGAGVRGVHRPEADGSGPRPVRCRHRHHLGSPRPGSVPACHRHGRNPQPPRAPRPCHRGHP